MDLDRLEEWSLPRFSWDYDHLSLSEHWFRMACAYLDCSHHLLEAMIEERLASSFHHAKVAVAIFEHAVELFLKGAIAHADQSVPVHHKSTELLSQYRKLYPGKEFGFSGEIDQAVSQTEATPRNQYARYPQDLGGRPWPGHTHIDLSLWYRQVRCFKEDFDRLWPLIRVKHRGVGP
ncbi:MAG: hypothetical protein HYY11_03605 [Candidatus Methylomirabilis oxyfera]|nr:hypothetical protein [Candidatus Methylomirabilis oxyfera]